MAFAPPETLTNRGVRQDFPLRNDMSITKANVKSGMLKPTKSVVTHPDILFDMLNVNVSTTSTPRVRTQDFINGYFFSSVALTAARTLTTPTAVNIVLFLGNLLNKNSTGISLAGTIFRFVIDNNQPGAFTRTLVGGAGVTLQGPGMDLSQNEKGVFSLCVHDNNEVTISRENHGPSTAETLAETLVAGNVTGGTDVVITGGDSITSTGQIPIVSSQAAADALRLNASNAAGGLDLDTGTGGIDADTTGQINLDSSQAAANAIRLYTSDAVGGLDLDTGTGGIDADTTGQINLDSSQAASDAIRLNTSDAAGGLDLDTGTGGVDINTSGRFVINSSIAIVAAIDLNATGGGITVDYEGSNIMPVSAGGVVIATFGTSAAPNLTVNNGDLVITGGTRGLVHTGSGTATQGTSNSTTVVLNTTTGVITMFGTVAATSTDSFAVTNSNVVATSVILLTVELTTAGQSPIMSVGAIAAGSFGINITNVGIGATAGTPQIHFMIINLA